MNKAQKQTTRRGSRCTKSVLLQSLGCLLHLLYGLDPFLHFLLTRVNAHDTVFISVFYPAINMTGTHYWYLLIL